MLRRSAFARLCFWMLLLTLAARPALACLVSSPIALKATHECCEHSCQHNHTAQEMDRCCRQQHSVTAQAAAPLFSKDAYGFHLNATSLFFLLSPQLIAPPATQFLFTRVGQHVDVSPPPPLYVWHLTLLI
jgi:hypothetical protein